jgi:hypothetical protein
MKYGRESAAETLQGSAGHPAVYHKGIKDRKGFLRRRYEDEL